MTMMMMMMMMMMMKIWEKNRKKRVQYSAQTDNGPSLECGETVIH